MRKFQHEYLTKISCKNPECIFFFSIKVSLCHSWPLIGQGGLALQSLDVGKIAVGIFLFQI